MEKRVYTRIEDLTTRNLRRCWHNARTQAESRGEAFELTWEDYLLAWTTDDRHLRKGTTNDAMVMARIDRGESWSLNNIEFITRRQQLKKKRKQQ